jgi:hypothetical protein
VATINSTEICSHCGDCCRHIIPKSEYDGRYDLTDELLAKYPFLKQTGIVDYQLSDGHSPRTFICERFIPNISGTKKGINTCRDYDTLQRPPFCAEAGEEYDPGNCALWNTTHPKPSEPTRSPNRLSIFWANLTSTPTSR